MENNYFGCYKLDIFMISYIVHTSKNCIIHHLEKSFSNYFLKFYLALYDFSQVFWLNLMALCILFKNNSWFVGFEFLMYMAYSFLLCKLATRFSSFSIFILSGKILNHCKGYVIFSAYWTSTSKKQTNKQKNPSFLSSL